MVLWFYEKKCEVLLLVIFLAVFLGVPCSWSHMCSSHVLCAVLGGSWVWQRYIHGGTILKACGILRILEYFWGEAGLVSLLSKTSAAFTRLSPKPSTMHQQRSQGMTSLVSVAVNTHIHYFVMPSVNGTCQGWSLKGLFLALVSAVCTHSIPLILLLHRITVKIASVLSLNC